MYFLDADNKSDDVGEGKDADNNDDTALEKRLNKKGSSTRKSGINLEPVAMSSQSNQADPNN